MMMSWVHAGPAILAAFLASFVEFVEALTIVLAVGAVRGWRPALAGSAAGTALLVVLVAALGPLLARVPLDWLRMGIGVLLLLFGMRWLRKAVLRGAGLIPLHDEDAAYAKETAALRRSRRGGDWDTIGIVTTFKAVTLEGLEVVFIVIAVGAAGQGLVPACLGAGAALAFVILIGLMLHRPMSRVPENGLKFVVGALLSAFGLFWTGEGIGLTWPGGDAAILGLIAGFLAVAFLMTCGARRVLVTGRAGFAGRP